MKATAGFTEEELGTGHPRQHPRSHKPFRVPWTSLERDRRVRDGTNKKSWKMEVRKRTVWCHNPFKRLVGTCTSMSRGSIGAKNWVWGKTVMFTYEFDCPCVSGFYMYSSRVLLPVNKANGTWKHWSASGPVFLTDIGRKWFVVFCMASATYFLWLWVHNTSREGGGGGARSSGQPIKRKSRWIEEMQWFKNDSLGIGWLNLNKVTLNSCFVLIVM